MDETIELTVNGETHAIAVAPNDMLIDVLRDRLGLKGAKIGCDRGVCGACTVLVDGNPTAACATFAWRADGADIVTIEGLAGEAGALDPVQQAFSDTGALQCGYCTPGMILLAKALLARNPHPDRTEIADWLGANICRCTGYKMIIDAVETAAGKRVGE
jgi:aerobic carbon-monoxide dehydrogenase small subunit